MNNDKIKKLFDKIDILCVEGWDNNDRSNFYSIMDKTAEIQNELDETTTTKPKGYREWEIK